MNSAAVLANSRTSCSGRSRRGFIWECYRETSRTLTEFHAYDLPRRKGMKSLSIGIVVLCASSALAFAVDAEGSFDRTLSVSGPVNLDVQTDSGGIVVTAGSGGSVHVHAILKAHRGSSWLAGDVEGRIRELERNPPIEQSGNTIRIGHVRERNFLRGISMRLEVTAPVASRVVARADSGG